MWIFGSANLMEMTELKKQGWEVQQVDMAKFNASLDPKYNPDEDSELIESIRSLGGYSLIAVFVDNDISKVLTQWHGEDKARKEWETKKVIEAERQRIAQDCFENSELDGLECLESDGWETDGDYLIKKFYYKNEGDELKGESLPATFVVGFKEGTLVVLDSHVNIW